MSVQSVMQHRCLARKVQDRHATLSSARCSLTPKSIAEVAMEARRINMLTLLLAPKGFSFSAGCATCTSGSCRTKRRRMSTTRRQLPFQGLCGFWDPLSTSCSSAKEPLPQKSFHHLPRPRAPPKTNIRMVQLTLSPRSPASASASSSSMVCVGLARSFISAILT